MALDQKHIILAFTGASGAQYGLRLLECLLRESCRVDVVFSKAALMVIAMETELKLGSRASDIQKTLHELYQAKEGQLRVYNRDDWMAPAASGSHRAASMVVCPCSMGSLSAIAQGASDNLIERAADVMIKEKRNLVVVSRETPLSAIHLENMLKLARLGVTIMPADPGYYQNPTSISDLIDFIVARILDHLNIEHELLARWGERSES